MTSTARCEAASTALDGFRQQNEPFMALAALTVGMLEMTLGRHDAARAHLTEANELGGRFGNNWLESGARTQLASLAVRAGHLDEARALLVESVDASEDTELSTQTVTFSLVAYCPARAGGRRCTAGRDGPGCRRWAAPARRIAGVAVDAARRGRAAPPAWRRRSIPTSSRTPSPPDRELNQREAVALVRGD